MAVGFVDRSGEGHVPTNNGVTSASAESIFGERSCYFDGASYLSYPDNTDLRMETEDFTIEGWINITTLPSSAEAPIITKWAGGHRSYELAITQTTHRVTFLISDDGNWNGDSVEGTTSLSADTWYHIAITYDGSNIRVYLDGILEGTYGYSSGAFGSSQNVEVGGLTDASRYFAGYIDGLRIHKGKALWTENFIPPTSPVEQVDEETVLLLHCDGTNGSTSFPDAGVTQHTVTANADAQVSTTESKFGGAAAYFDGTGDYLSIPDSTDWDFGSDDFTLEMWVKYDSVSGFKSLLAQYSSNNYWHLYHYGVDNKFYFKNRVGGVYNIYFTVNHTPVVDTWYHFALVRRNTTDWKFYVDGVSQTITWDAHTSDIMGTFTAPLTIGYDDDLAAYFNGYIDELRISKGIARWTEDFIPPVEPYPAYDVPVTVDDETVLLLHCDGDDASTTFKDFGVTGHTVTANDDAQVSTTESKFGGASAYFDGTGDYLTFPASTDFNFDGEFTIEFWYNTSIATSDTQFLNKRGASWNTGDFNIAINNGGVAGELAWVFNNGSTQILASTVTGTNDGEWHHLAVTRDISNVMRLFVDGSLENSVTDSVSLSNSDALDCPSDSGGFRYAGYLDEIRISKDIARWTENFTPPTFAYPDVKDTDTKLLIHAESIANKEGYTPDTYIKDSSESNHDIFLYGDCTLSATQSKFGNKSMYFDGTGDYLSVPDSDDWYFSGDFTIDTWVRFSSLGTTGRVICGQSVNDDNRWYLGWVNNSNLWRFLVRSSATNIIQVEATDSISIDTWYHLALSRSGNTFRLFVDGVDITSAGGSDSDAFPDYASPLEIGQGNTGGVTDYMDGYIDELRISKGIARWTAAFTAPTSPYSDYM